MSTKTGKAPVKKARALTNERISMMKVGNITECLDGWPVLKDNQRISDGTGLFIQVSKTGRKMFRFVYRNAEGKQTVVSIGRFDNKGDGTNSFTLEQAQAHYLTAIDALKRERIDPKEARIEEKTQATAAREKKGRTFTAYVAEWVAEQGFARNHQIKVEERIKKCCKTIENKPIDSITGADLRFILDALTLAGKRDTAHRLYLSLRQIFQTARRKRYIPSTPIAEIYPDDYPAVKNKPFKHTTDLMTLQKVLRAIDEYATGEPQTIIALKLMPHVFLRHSELRTMKWSDVDLEKGVWNLHKAKVQGRSIYDAELAATPTDFSVPLSETTTAFLKQLQVFSTGEYVFALRDSDKPISDSTLSKALREILKKANIPGATTVHGFRYTARSLIPAKFGVTYRVIEQQLSHSTLKSSDKYGYDQYMYFPERRAMMNVWSDFLEGVKTKYRELSQKEALMLADKNLKTEWERFVDELKERFHKLARAFEQVGK